MDSPWSQRRAGHRTFGVQTGHHSTLRRGGFPAQLVVDELRICHRSPFQVKYMDGKWANQLENCLKTPGAWVVKVGSFMLFSRFFFPCFNESADIGHDIWKMNPFETMGTVVRFKSKRHESVCPTRNFSREEFKWQHAVVTTFSVGFTCLLLVWVAKIKTRFTLFLWVGKNYQGFRPGRGFFEGKFSQNNIHEN